MYNRRDRWLTLSLLFIVFMTWGACSGGGSSKGSGGAGGHASGGEIGSGGQSGNAGAGGVDSSCGAGATAVNLLSNGGFEQPALGAAGALQFFEVGSTALPGWSVIGTSGGDCSAIQTPFGFQGFTYTAAEGVQFMDLTGHNDVNGVSDVGVEQTVTTVAGKTYFLSFFVGNQFDPAGGLNGQTSKVAALMNGAVVLHAVNSDMPPNNTNSWKRFCVRFVAAGPTTTIGLRSEDPVSDTSDVIDNVSVLEE